MNVLFIGKVVCVRKCRTIGFVLLRVGSGCAEGRRDGVVRSAETALSEGVCAVRDLDLMWQSADNNHKLELRLNSQQLVPKTKIH